MARVYNILLTARVPILPLYLWQSCVARRTCQLHPQNGNKDSAESAWNMVRSLWYPRGMLPSDKHLVYCNFTCRPPKMGEHGIIAFPTKMYTVVFILYFYVVLFTAMSNSPSNAITSFRWYRSHCAMYLQRQGSLLGRCIPMYLYTQYTGIYCTSVFDRGICLALYVFMY